MKIYLAGFSSHPATTKPFFDGKESVFQNIKGAKELFDNGYYDSKLLTYKPYALESFYYINKFSEEMIPKCGAFLLDSGAFTFMSNAKKDIDWYTYVDAYANFINKHGIENFFELDIDSVVGYEVVKELRRRLENKTNRQVIPVWHKSRGVSEFTKMCKEYKYVAIGGIVSKEITKSQYSGFPSLISEAHRNGAKIHGLGFTNLKWLKVCHFDSVDSTSWVSGNRFGIFYNFDGKKMRQSTRRNQRIDLSKMSLVNFNNYMQWLKLQKWADAHL